MKKSVIYRIGLAIIAAICILSIRIYEDKLFYDPFKNFFRLPEILATFPTVDYSKLSVSYGGRFILNHFFSALIIALLFNSKKYAKQFLLIGIVALPILFLVGGILLANEFSGGRLVEFYIRRIIIHPLFLLICLPYFYLIRKYGERYF